MIVPLCRGSIAGTTTIDSMIWGPYSTLLGGAVSRSECIKCTVSSATDGHQPREQLVQADLTLIEFVANRRHWEPVSRTTTWQMFSGESHPLWLRKSNREPGEQWSPLGTLVFFGSRGSLWEAIGQRRWSQALLMTIQSPWSWALGLSSKYRGPFSSGSGEGICDPEVRRGILSWLSH